jgi:glucan phosphoethanolaminetransferase (alkaline phosphatase superfamily)
LRPGNEHAGVMGAGNTAMAFLAHHFSNIVTTDFKTIAIICLLCGLAAFFIKEYLAHPRIVIFVYPVLVACSILAHYVFNLFKVYPNNRLDQWLMWTIMAAICGTRPGSASLPGP